MEPNDGFTVKTGGFEGPLDLLLSLIEKRKMHISEISLAKIADEYLAFVEGMEEFPIRDTAHFLVVASTLVLIKSRSLLPQLELTEEEEENIEDLETRLKQYQRIKELSRHVRERFGAHVSFQRDVPKDTEPVFAPTKELAPQLLRDAIKRVIANLPRKEAIPQVVVRKAVTLEDMMEDLAQRISRALSLSFRDFAGKGKAEKVDVVVGFLAMLELVKRGLVEVSQEEHFGDITIEQSEVGVPRYY